MRQRQNAQNYSGEASFPRVILCILFALLCNVNLLNKFSIVIYVSATAPFFYGKKL